MQMLFKLRPAAILGVLCAITLHADAVTQNFEDFPAVEFESGPSNVETNGWTINDVLVQTEAATYLPSKSGTKVAWLPDAFYSGISTPTNSYIETPLLTNGVGSVVYYLYNSSQGAELVGPYTCQLQINTNGVDWITFASINNTGKSGWVGYTNTINQYVPIRLRWFRSTALSDYSWLGVDAISTTEAPARVDISDLAISPASPAGGEAVSVSAVLTPSSLATITAVQLFWSTGGGASNTISMSHNGGTGRYETDDQLPGQPALTVINYTVHVTFTGFEAQSPATASSSFFFRQPPLQSIFDSVTVKGDLTNSLDLVDNGYWTGVQSVGALEQTDLYFETDDGTITRWRDPSPSRTILPLFGDLTSGAADNIRLDGTDAGWLLLSFDETGETYAIEQAAYQSFNDWSGAGTYTNVTIDGWTLTRGRAIDNALALDGYSLQFQDTTSERAIATPALANGIGFIQFNYRNTETNGLNPAAFHIQTRASASAPWSTQATVTGILAPNYLFYRLEINRFEWKYARIVATGPAIGQLLIDNLAISTLEYPADVTIVDHGIVSAAPRSGETVTFSARLDATAPTTSTNATLALSVAGSPVANLSLTYNTGNGRFETTLPTNLPALVTHDYTLQVSFTGPHSAILSPKEATGDFYLRTALPQSPYSEVRVAGDLVAPLDLVENNYWIGVIPVGALADLDIYFESINGTTKRWSDPELLRTVLPVFGTVVSNVLDDIRIDSTDAGWLLLSFDETGGTYAIEQAAYQSFNDWSGAGTYTNVTIDGWTLTRGRAIDNALALDGYSLQFQDTISERAIAAPALSNGIGSIAFRYRNSETHLLSPAAFVIQTRATSADSWQTVVTVSNIISPDYLFYRLEINNFEWKYARIVATGPATGQLLIDNLAISTLEYPADVTIVDHGIVSAVPRAGETVTFSARLDATAQTTGTSATLELSVAGSPVANLSLTYNTGNGRFETTLPTNLPALVTFDYTLQVSFTGPHAAILSPKYATGSFHLRAALPQSPYSGVSLAGDLVSPLDLVANNYWIGVIPVGTLANLEVYFESINGTTNQWNDPELLRTSLPVFGEFALSTNAADNIAIGATEPDWLLATFDENRGRYGIQQADYQSFNTWSAYGTPGTYTNGGWILTRGLATANAALAFDGYSVQFQSNTLERAIASPALTNGIGTIAFRYRNTDVTLLSPAAFAIQVRPTPVASWSTVETVTGIISPDYLYHSVTVASLDQRYIRIAATNGTAAAQLLIDDIVITRPGATVSFAGLTHAPPDPTILDLVNVTVNISPLNGAELNGANLFFRAGDSGIYDRVTMTNTGGDQYTGTIPRGARALMQYYVETTYLNPATGGYRAAQDPLDRTGFPAAYTNSDVILENQNFADFPPVDFNSNPGNVQTNGWTINDVLVQAEAVTFLPPKSGTKVAWLPDAFFSGISTPTNSYIETPLLSNGVGSVVYHLYNSGGQGPYNCQLQINTNGSWKTFASINNTGKSGWVGYTNTINHYGPIRLRWFRSTALADYSWIGVDAITLTYPPAYVTARDFDLHPAYPSQEEPTTVACTIESATFFHPAFNITGTLHYRSNNQVTGWPDVFTPVPMDRFGSRFYGDIPAQLNLSEVEYYVEADFKGYSAEGENQSPMTFPESTLDYTVRRYISAYARMNVIIGTNTTEFVQLGNGLWEGVIFLDATNQPAFGIDGYDYYDGTNINSGLYSWGDNNQFRTNMPLAGTATIGALPITIPDNPAQDQYIVRFDENTDVYSIQRAAFQDFENWPADNTFFGESFAAARITRQTQYFDDWAISQLFNASWLEDFESGWDDVYVYTSDWVIAESVTTGVNLGYQMYAGIVVTQLVGQAGLLAPEPSRGYLVNYPNAGDIGSFSFELRAASPNDFRPAIYSSLTNESIMISAKIRANDMPTNRTPNSIGFAYTSILGAYSDSDNYYELRIVQTAANNRRFEIWQKNGGTLSRLGASANLGNSITREETVSFLLFREALQWRLQAFLNGNPQRINVPSSGTRLPGKGIGFNAMDASPSVDWVRVYSITNANYNNATNLIYEENFTTSPPAGWDNSSGVWTGSGDGRYTRPGYTGSPLTARVEYSATKDGLGTVIDTFSNLTHTDYRRYTSYPHIATNGYIRVKNYAGSGYLIVDNVERTNWRSKTVSTSGWVATNVWVEAVGQTGKGIEFRHSRTLAGASQALLSPTLTKGASLIEFDYRSASDATGPVRFDIEYQVPHQDWQLLTTVNNSIQDRWVPFAYGINDPALRADITRIRLRNTTPGHDDGLRIDNLVITELVPVNNTTWWGYNVLVTTNKPTGIVDNFDNPWRARLAGNKKGAFLNNSIINGTGGRTNNLYLPFIQSAYLPSGIGEIRFLYRAWDTTAATIKIVASTNRYLPQAQWTTLDTLTVDSTKYQEYYNAIFERDFRYLSIQMSAVGNNSGRVGLDNIMITAPLAADLRLSKLRTIPEVPLPGDDVYVEVMVDDLFFSPAISNLYLLHNTGTANWGNHSGSTSVFMDRVHDYGTSFVYRSSSPIQSKAIDTVVQYQIKATFGGFFADKSSPKYYRGFNNPKHYWPVDLNRNQLNQTPYYIVFSCLPGQVWINELNVKDDIWGIVPPGPQFVEVVGVGNAPVGNWRIEVINPNFTTNSSYTIPGGTKLGSASDDYGFYVLGDSTVTNRNLTLTNTLPASAGIQIVRSMGAFEDQISYDVDTVSVPRPGAAMTNPVHNQRYVYAGVERTDLASYSLSLKGSGSNSTDFAWSNAGDFNTIGSANTGQTLIPWPTHGPVIPREYTGTVEIAAAWRKYEEDRWVMSFDVNTESTDLVPSVWYTTTLLNIAPGDWQRQTAGFNWSRSNTTYHVECNEVPPPVFYKIGVSVAP